MTGFTGGGQTQPGGRFFRRSDADRQRPPVQIREVGAAFVEEELGVGYQFTMILREPSRPVQPAGLFVRRGQKDHVAPLSVSRVTNWAIPSDFMSIAPRP